MVAAVEHVVARFVGIHGASTHHVVVAQPTEHLVVAEPALQGVVDQGLHLVLGGQFVVFLGASEHATVGATGDVLLGVVAAKQYRPMDRCVSAARVLS